MPSLPYLLLHSAAYSQSHNRRTKLDAYVQRLRDRPRWWCERGAERVTERERASARTLVRTKVKHLKFPKHYCLASCRLFIHLLLLLLLAFCFIRYNRRYNYLHTHSRAHTPKMSKQQRWPVAAATEAGAARTRADARFIFSATIMTNTFAIFSSLLGEFTYGVHTKMCTLRLRHKFINK